MNTELKLAKLTNNQPTTTYNEFATGLNEHNIKLNNNKLELVSRACTLKHNDVHYSILGTKEVKEGFWVIVVKSFDTDKIDVISLDADYWLHFL